MYNKWINGTSISEIVKKTGIRRKTWNKRFERYEKQLEMPIDNNLEIVNGHKGENMAVQSSDNRNKTIEIARKVSANNTGEPIKKFFTALGAIAVLFAIFLIYIEMKKKRTKETERITIPTTLWGQQNLN
jgi:hypothetical protein